MAMVANTWYTITLDPLADPPYTANTYFLHPVLVNLLITGTPVYVFCTFDGGAASSANISFFGGSAIVPSDAVNITSTPAMETTLMDSGATWYSVRGLGGQWYWYDDVVGLVQTLTNPVALGTFIS